MKRSLSHTIGFFLFLALYPITIQAQVTSDLNELGLDSCNQGALHAASLFLYADYLNRREEFSDLELTAYLLTLIDEYSAADSLLQIVNVKKDINESSDSLRFFYYASRARIDHNKFDNINALQSLATISLTPELYELKASCYEELGLYEKALQAYTMIPSEYDPIRTSCLIGNCYRQMGSYSDAIEYFTKAMNADPDWAYPYYGIGWSYELAGDDENALMYYNEGLRVDPSYAYLFLMRGEMYLKKGNKDLADKDFNAILRLDKQLEDGTCRQYALHFLGHDEHALTWMNRLIDLQPNDPGHYYDKACLCCRMGLESEAIKAMSIAFEKGYRRFSHLNSDDDLDPIKNNPEYVELYKKYLAIYEDELQLLKDI